MNRQAELKLERSPHPLKWGIAMLILVLIAAVWHSVIVAILAGIAIGAYFGNYRGRFAVMEAWRLQMDSDYEDRKAELETLYRSSLC